MFETVIVGAGPYGLSIAAHFRSYGVPFRIFGRPMDSWIAHMPKGMLLKSDGFASNIYDPTGKFTLKQFCFDRGIEYADLGLPVRLETFSEYGLAFRERIVPDLEDKLVTSIDRLQEGFVLRLDDGQEVNAKRIVLAVGITHFTCVPEELSHLPKEFVSHSFDHHDLESFRQRNVVVLGGGSSAVDLAGLLHEKCAGVQLIARQTALRFHNKQAMDKPRSWWERVRRPQSGLGPGLRSRFFADAPMWFHYLPERLRLESVRTQFGPAGGWFAKEKVVDRVPLHLGYTLKSAQVRREKVHLQLRRIHDGADREIVTEHVIAATGYTVDLQRLKFLSREILSDIRSVNGTPVLSSNFESTIPGLYFVGIAAANSFGPVMRFAYGASFAARRITHALLKARAGNPHPVLAPGVVALGEREDPSTREMAMAIRSGNNE
jgi:cation diffusion facilitator CzcD-associated flavoprotein CzcO